MFARRAKNRLRFLLSAAIALTVAGVFVGSLAFARVVLNTIDPVAIITGNGRHLIVTGPIECTEGERAELRVTVTQRETGAVAEGHGFITCAGVIEQWEVNAVAYGKASFTEGPATAVGVGLTTSRGKATDAHQWLVDITLVGE